MTNEQILNKLMEVKRGRYINFTKMSDLGQGVIKQTDMVIRLGVKYSNMEINAERETGSLPWGQWVEGLENLVIEHKGNYYLRITSTDPAHPESGADVIATRYIYNNEEVSKEFALSIADNKKPSKPSAVYNVKFSNIIKLGN